MKLSSGQKKELKGMLTLLIASIVLWVIASLLLHFPWEHTVVLTCIALVISIFSALSPRFLFDTSHYIIGFREI